MITYFLVETHFFYSPHRRRSGTYPETIYSDNIRFEAQTSLWRIQCRLWEDAVVLSGAIWSENETHVPQRTSIRWWHGISIWRAACHQVSPKDGYSAKAIDHSNASCCKTLGNSYDWCWKVFGNSLSWAIDFHWHSQERRVICEDSWHGDEKRTTENCSWGRFNWQACQSFSEEIQFRWSGS